MTIFTINLILSFIAALVLHELGHLLAARACRVSVTQAGFGWGPRLLGFRVAEVDYQLLQQLFVLLAGVGVNFILSGIAWGTLFGTINLLLAVGNLFPLYQQDGWKSGMVIWRSVFRRPSPLVEWSFTLSAGVLGLMVVASTLFSC